ncbi:N-acetylmuramoyl-L-alanine amidase, partial [bacterium]|nr:N-acetylmuramoyl-L-alanine amidase [bacterium]
MLRHDSVRVKPCSYATLCVLAALRSGVTMKLRRSIHIPQRHLRRLVLVTGALAFSMAFIVAAPASAKPLVVVDPGHGGIYNHARYGTFLEKQANLLVAFELGRQLYAAGYDVQFTRITDTAITYGDLYTWHWADAQGLWFYERDGLSSYADGVPRDDLQARCNVANDMGADIFISVHCNGAASSAASGTENWASSHDVLGQQLGRFVQSAVLEQTHQRDRGAGQQDFYVVRWTNMPALLLETGFMSNPTEGAWIASPSWRARYVAGVVNGINRWWATNPARPIHSRYTGSTRSETAVIASQMQWPAGADTVVLAHTLDVQSAYAAPLVTARLGAPLLFADFRGLSPATAAELTRLGPSRIIALGTELTDTALAEAAAAAGIDASAVTRIAGSEPAAAAALVSASLISAETSTTLVFASGDSPGDALAGASLAAARGAALVLSR